MGPFGKGGFAMNRTVIIALLLVVLGLGAWYMSGGGQGAVDAVKEGASDAAGAAGEAAGAAKDAVGEAAGAATEAAESATSGAMDAAAILDPGNFDPQKVAQLIEDSDIDPQQKGLLNDLVQQAAQNPDMIASVLQEIRAALGL